MTAVQAKKKLYGEVKFSKKERQAARRSGKQTIPNEKIVAASRLVYEHDLTYAQVSKMMSISVSYLAKLVTDAKRDGVIKVTVTPGLRIVKSTKAKKAA